MKFLCMRCDEPMSLDKAEPPKDGSITAIFGCANCDNRIAMLTNPMETQTLTSLGVQVGPGGEAEEGVSKCPFSGMVLEMEAQGTEAQAEVGVGWTAGALERLENIPEFVRPMAKQGIEHFARSNGHGIVDEAVLEEARGRFNM